MLTVNAYAAASPTTPLRPTRIERRDLGPHDVMIEVKYCGICHTDIHWVRGDWGAKDYPVVPGHEMTGIVTEAGDAVTRHAIGDRVGVGCMVNSCRECANCRKGCEQYCLKGNILTYGSIDRDGTLTQGGYSTHIVVTEDFALKIPDGLALDAAAPLLCAGATTFTPLQRWGGLPGTQQMLDFCAAHGVGAEIETIDAKLINEAYDRVLVSDVRYRFVIDNSTLA